MSDGGLLGQPTLRYGARVEIGGIPDEAGLSSARPSGARQADRTARTEQGPQQALRRRVAGKFSGSHQGDSRG